MKKENKTILICGIWFITLAVYTMHTIMRNKVYNEIMDYIVSLVLAILLFLILTFLRTEHENIIPRLALPVGFIAIVVVQREYYFLSIPMAIITGAIVYTVTQSVFVTVKKTVYDVYPETNIRKILNIFPATRYLFIVHILMYVVAIVCDVLFELAKYPTTLLCCFYFIVGIIYMGVSYEMCQLTKK